MMVRNGLMLLLGALALAGCNTDPPTRVQLPTTVRPNPAPVANADGSIYRASGSRPLFEDRRARFVGDIVTVTLVENTSANRTSKESFDRKGSANVNVKTPTVLGVTPKPPFSVSAFNNNVGGSGNFDSSFNANSEISSNNNQNDGNTNSFRGSIAVTVIEVLPNGNLMVSGEKQVAINQGTEFVRLSGVINPVDISGRNTVNSTQIADARIESKQSQSVDTAQLLSMFARFFVTLVPF